MPTLARNVLVSALKRPDPVVMVVCLRVSSPLFSAFATASSSSTWLNSSAKDTDLPVPPERRDERLLLLLTLPEWCLSEPVVLTPTVRASC